MNFLANVLATFGVGANGSPAEETLIIFIDEPEMPKELVERA